MEPTWGTCFCIGERRDEGSDLWNLLREEGEVGGEGEGTGSWPFLYTGVV